MAFALFNPPIPDNEPVRSYAPGTRERASLQRRLQEMSSREVEIPLVIGGKEVRSGDLGEIRPPHRTSQRLGTYHKGGAAQVEQAARVAVEAQRSWSALPWEERAAVFLRAAEMLSGPWRDTLNAATMLGQSKTCHQAEIDSACELIDFLRFNVHYMAGIYADQPRSSPGVWNRLEYRPLEGFIFAVTPFNFTAIAGNLPTSPAMLGNVVLWKPASSAVYSAYYFMKLLEAAGLPPGVINMVPGSGAAIGDPVLANPHLAGLHFTGSTDTFQGMWRTMAGNLPTYRAYPRIVGETGGKDFVVAHASAEVEPLVAALVRGAFEFQGQKCSAASRCYIPDNLWPRVRERMADEIATLRMGDVRDFRNFMGAVIDRAAFKRIRGYLDYAASTSGLEVLCGGRADDSEGWFVQPTVVRADDPRDRMMAEEIFGPVLTVYVYPEKEYAQALDLCDTTSPYGLTGAVFATDRQAVALATERLRHAAGNFYVNDKPTGAVVSQQPFGGGRASGTNDKAGSALNLLRWCSARAIKETLSPPTDYRYPFLEPDPADVAAAEARA